MKNYLLFISFLFLLVSCGQKMADETPDRLINKHEPYEEFFLQRSFPDKTVDISAFEKALHQAKNADLLKDGVGFNSEWTVQGPGNIGARINTIAVHPTNSDVIYVGFSRGGVWKTIDGGTNWLPIFDDQLFLAIGDIEIDPQNPNTVYVGTGDPNISGLPFIGDGVYKSTDAGATWTNIGLTDTRITSRILVDPTDSDKLYVGTMGIPFEPTTDKGLYRSLDGGETWEQSLFVTDTAGIIDIVINPQNPDILYAASWNRIRNNQQSRVHGEDAKVWKTTNGGETWTVLEGGLPTGDLGRIGLTMSAQNPGKVYALYVGANSHLYGIYRTENGGNSWSEIPTTGNFEYYPNETDLKDFSHAGFGWYFAKIRIDPENDDHIYFCGVELWEGFVFNNENAAWAQASPVWYFYDVHADKHDLVYTPDGSILLATDGGLYKKGPNDFEWEDIENIPTSQFYRVAYNPHNPNNYYGGMQDNGTSGGNAAIINNWPRIYGGDGFQPAFNPENPNIMFAETQRGNIVISTDGGNFFDSANDGIDNNDRRNWDMPYMLSHHNPSVMYTGTEKAYSGFFNGFDVDWSSFTEDLTDGNIYGGGAYHSITTLDESHFNEGVLYYGTTDGNVWRVVSSGSSIQNITAGLPERYVTDIKTSPDLPLTVYVTHSGYKDNEFIPRVHRSDDEGNSWVDISSNLPDLAINDIYILPDNQDSVLFVATDGGVYGSLNAGQNWERMGTNMPYVPVYDLEWNVAKNELIAGTFARSIMTYSIDSLMAGDGAMNPPDTTILATREVIDKKSRLKIFPSPATNYVQIEFEKSEPGKTYDLVILNAAGKLMHKEQGTQEGKISQRIDISHITTGTYFVKIKFRHTIRTGSFVKK